MTSTTLRRPTDNYPVERAVTDVVDVLRGNRGGQIRLRGYSGDVVSTSGGSAGTALSSGGFPLDVQSPIGNHIAVLHSGTAADAAPTTANSVLLVTDAGFAIGFGKSIRIYETAGTDYTELTSADGLMTVGGSGVSAGIVAVTALRVGATPATTGAIRLTNNTGAFARNQGNTADINLIGANASNQVLVGDAANTPLTVVQSLTTVRLLVGASAILDATATGVGITPPILAIGTNPATTGFVRGPNNNGLYARNATNSGDVHMIGVNSSDQIGVGQTGNALLLQGTVVAPNIDPPTVDGQVTTGSQVRAYASVTVSGGVASLRHNYNIASVTYNAAGDYSIAWDKDFVNAFYACFVTVEHTSLLIGQINATKANTGADVHIRTAAGVKTDPAAFHVLAIGAF